MRRLLVDILERRGMQVTEAVRGHIEQCDDIDRLVGWCSRAATWTGEIAELFDDPTQ